MNTVVFAAIFMVVTVILFIVWMLVAAGNSQDQVRRRMDSVRKAERRGAEVSLGLKIVRDEMMSSVPLIHRMMMQWSWSVRLREYLVQAGIRIKPAKLVMLSGALAIGGYLLVKYAYGSFPLAVLCGVATGIAPFLYVAWKRQRRLRRFEEQFPEALDLMGRAVRAGHAFTTGLEMIAKESAEPVAGEFRTCFEEQNFGLPLRDALLNLSERVPLMDVRFFVTAVLVQKETGGNMAEILDGLARVIRERFRIYRDVKTRTAQGRLTAGLLISLPIFMLFMLRLLNPTYVGVLFEDPWGPPVLALAAALQVIGSMILWKIIHIEV